MAFTRITNVDRNGKGNVGLPDTPLLTTTELQEQMDSLPNLAIDKHNEFLDELEDASAALSIGCVAPVGVTTTLQTIQGVINAIGAILNTTNVQKHTHNNKETLDTFTPELVTALTGIATLLSGISSIEATLTNNAAAIPTSQAVYDFMNTADLKGNILNTIYPIGAIYQTTTTDPDTIFSTSGKWTLLSTSSDGIKTYKRTS